MKLCNIHIKNLMILSVSGTLEGFNNWQKVAEIGYQLVHDRAGKGLALFLIWRHRLNYIALTLCEHACKTVFDVKSRIDPCPSPARSWDKAYQISGCTVARKKFRCLEKKLSCFWNSFKLAVFGVRCTLRKLASNITQQALLLKFRGKRNSWKRGVESEMRKRAGYTWSILGRLAQKSMLLPAEAKGQINQVIKTFSPQAQYWNPFFWNCCTM